MRTGVVFCTDGVFPHQVGGMQRHSRLLVEELAKTDLDLHVIHPHTGIQVYDDHYGITEHVIAGIDTEKNYLKESKAYSKRVYEVLKQLPDNYVIYNQGFAVWYRISEFKNRVITNPHGLEPFQALGAKDKLIAVPFKRVFSKIFKESLYTVSLGGHLTGILEKIVGAKAIVNLPNAVSLNSSVLNKPKPEKEEPLVCFFVARFASNKGIHILMQAIEELNQEGYANKFQFKLGGKGPLYQQYKESCKFPNVELLGFVSDEELHEYYASADLFVFPTLFEGMPTVVLEAMCHYLPIIVSDTGATCELVDNTNGYLIPPGDVSQFKEALKDYYQLSALDKNTMSERSHAKVKANFTWNKVAAKHVALFTEIANKL